MGLMGRIPGGQIIIPLLVAMLVNTLFPAALSVGGPATALLHEGGQALMGLFLVICGARIEIGRAGLPLYKGSVLLVLKLGFGAALGWGAAALFGPAGALGITPFILFCAIPSNNSSLYLALSSEYGDASDAGAISVIALKNGPMGTMVIMGLSGAAHLSAGDLVGTALPIAIGLIWGNIDHGFRDLCLRAQPLIVIFLSLTIGAKSSMGVLLTAGMSGIILALIALAVGFAIQFIYGLALKRPTPLGLAMGTVAANSALTPAVIAAADPSFAPQVPAAAAQCATASIITMLAIPLLVGFLDRRLR